MTGRVALGIILLLAANAAWILLGNLAVSSLLGRYTVTITGDMFLLFVDIVVPAALTMLTLVHLDPFRLPERLGSGAVMGIGMAAPIVTFALTYTLTMPGCWPHWLAGQACSW